MCTKTSWLAVLVIISIGSSLLADIPPPPPPAKPVKGSLPVKVAGGDLTKEGKNVLAKISIPRALLREIDGPVPVPMGPPGFGAPPPGAGAPPSAEPRGASLPNTSTIIAGFALSLGAASMLFIWRGGKKGKTLAGAGLIIAIFACGYAVADLRFPDEDRKPPVKEQIVVELTEDGEVITLTLPKK